MSGRHAVPRLDLQFFAQDGPGGEKTEEATSKKLSDARDKGQVAKSREIANGLGLLTLFLVLRFWVGVMGEQLLGVFPKFYLQIPSVVTFWNGNLPERDIEVIFRQMVLQVLLVVGLVFAVTFTVAFLSDLAQVKWKPTLEPLKPKLSRFSPVSGFKRLFSMNAIVELVKSVAKIGLILWICYGYLRDKSGLLYLLFDIPLMQAISLMGQTVTDLGIRISLVYMVIAVADRIYQSRKFAKDMRMTKQEVKDEYKQSEGDPKVKGKIRGKMREASQRRMMQNLPQADVVITNPTHFAVAIRYEPEKSEAPTVIAKGEDYLAARIKEIAKEHKIEIVENKPLARMLYTNVEVGQAVPPELYQAVAEVLAYVYHLQGKV
ncbi:MAG: flagellar biosynthesis protein FlhB [Clostridium sp.]|jgi:flagellar biosynthetic protein FlhB|nr:flagellar biosynthesis protein FlhB [Clostridium sp.]